MTHDETIAYLRNHDPNKQAIGRVTAIDIAQRLDRYKSLLRLAAKEMQWTAPLSLLDAIDDAIEEEVN